MLETVWVFSRRECDVDVGQPVAIGGVEHRAVDDAGRQVGRAAAARVEHDVVGGDAAVVVVADRPVGAEIVALAGEDEIVVAVEPELARARRSARAASAASAAQAQAWLSLPPKPPPIRRVSTVTKESGRPRMRATMCWTSVGSWVEV